MTSKSNTPKQKGRTLEFSTENIQVVLPFGIGLKTDECSFEIKNAKVGRAVVAKWKKDPRIQAQIYPPYVEVERMMLNDKSVRVKFWVVVSDLDRLRARQLIEREHYLMPPARGMFLVCGMEENAQQKKPRIIGVAVLDSLMHGNPKVGRSQFAKETLGSDAWLTWPRDKIVKQLRVAWASRFAVHSSYHGRGVGTRLASHLKKVARGFRFPSANFIEVITTVPRPPKEDGERSASKTDFLVRAGYTRLEEPLKSSPLQRLDHETGYMYAVSARKYYYYVDLRND